MTCDDGNAGTQNDVCQTNGSCAGVAPPQCLVTGCNDNNSCTVDTCGTNGCTFDPAPRRGMSCDDGNARTINDVCQTNGSCAGTAAQCIADADCPAPADMCAGPQACVANRCQAGTSPRPNETSCNDGNAATRYDVCRSGVCRGFACGSDAQCSDNQGCNGVERCVNNTCAAGTPMVCGDGNVCNGTETCSNGACVSGTMLAVPDRGRPCFDAFCDPVMGCRVQTHPDGTTCTTQTSAQPGMCSMGVCVANPTTPPPDPNTPPTDPNTAEAAIRGAADPEHDLQHGVRARRPTCTRSSRATPRPTASSSGTRRITRWARSCSTARRRAAGRGCSRCPRRTTAATPCTR